MKSGEKREFHVGLKMLARSSVIVLGALVLSKVFSYVYRILIARWYGPEPYGLFTLAMMVTGWFVVFAGVGLEQGLLRFLSLYRGRGEKQKQRYLFQRAMQFLIPVGIFFGLVLFFAAEWIGKGVFHSSELVPFLKIFAIVIPFSVLFSATLAALLAFEFVGWYAFLFNILQNLLKVLLLAGLIFAGMDLLSIPFSYLSALVISFFVALVVLHQKVWTLFVSYKLTTWKERRVFRNVLAYSWPLLFFGILSSVFQWTDTFVLGIFTDVSSVGLYNAAMPIAALLAMASEMFMQLFFPLVTKEFGRGRKEVVKQLSQQVGKWVLMINVPLFALMVLFPGAFLNILFGGEYLVAAGALRILSVGFLFLSLFTISQRLLSMAGKSKTILVNIVVAGVTNIGLNVLLIPRYGLEGAALATVISMFLLGLLFVVQTKRLLGIVPVRRKLVSVVVSGAVGVGVLLWLRSLVGAMDLWRLGLLGLVFVGVYGVMLLAMETFDKDDLVIFEAVKKKLMS